MERALCSEISNDLKFEISRFFNLAIGYSYSYALRICLGIGSGVFEGRRQERRNGKRGKSPLCMGVYFSPQRLKSPNLGELK
jgi:hypothetical protein